jgi:protein TonB
MEPKKNPKYDVHKNSRMIFFLSLCFSLLLVLSAFQWKRPITIPELKSPGDATIYDPLYPVPITEIRDPLPSKPEPIKEKPLLLNPVEVDAVETVLVELPDIIAPEVPVAIPKEFIPPTENIDTFFVVEKMPLPKDGYEGFYKFLSNELQYPASAIRSNTQGKVFIEFVVNKKGEPSNLRVSKGIGYGCDEEALRVIALTKWEAGRQRGVPVNVKMTLGVQFKLK